ncbi:MAG: hypothetical protein AB7H80_13280, partial [Candidatus Kapaibacterium sp.]
IQNELGGVGIWALGYDNGYTELWELLGMKFGKKKYADSICSVFGTSSAEGSIYPILPKLLYFRPIILLCKTLSTL